MPGGWTGSTRRQRLPTDWPRRRAKVLRRDGYRCQWTEPPQGQCPVVDRTGRGLDVDHVNRHAGDELTNLRTLCRDHHRVKSAQEGVAAQPRRQRPVEPHPGLVDDDR